VKLWIRFNQIILVIVLILGVPGFTVWRESLIWINFQSYAALVLSVLAVLAGARAEKAAKESD
jgi:hypothetical protein